MYIVQIFHPCPPADPTLPSSHSIHMTGCYHSKIVSSLFALSSRAHFMLHHWNSSCKPCHFILCKIQSRWGTSCNTKHTMSFEQCLPLTQYLMRPGNCFISPHRCHIFLFFFAYPRAIRVNPDALAPLALQAHAASQV